MIVNNIFRKPTKNVKIKTKDKNQMQIVKIKKKRVKIVKMTQYCIDEILLDSEFVNNSSIVFRG